MKHAKRVYLKRPLVKASASYTSRRLLKTGKEENACSYNNTRLHVDKIAERLGITSQPQFYKLAKEFSSHVGKNEDIHELLQEAYPEYTWTSWIWKEPPASFWNQMDNQRAYFDRLSELFGIQHIEDWKEVNIDDIKTRGGAELLRTYYNNSLFDAVRNVYPEANLKRWVYEAHLPRGFWSDEQNQKEYLDWLAEMMGVRIQEDWYKVKSGDFVRNRGKHLLRLFKDSLSITLENVYPQFIWHCWKFGNVRNGFWNDFSNQKMYMEWLAEELGIQEINQWYDVNSQVFLQYGGGGLIRLFNYRLEDVLTVLYPGSTWHPWLFRQLPDGFWHNKQNVKDFVEFVKKTLNICTEEEWVQVSYIQISQLGGASLMKKYTLPQLLSESYPEHDWDVIFKRQTSGIGKALNCLNKQVHQLFPKCKDISVNYKHPQLKYSTSRAMELDIFIPSLALAFEYQGEHHYVPHKQYGLTEPYAIRDNEKRIAAQNAGITLISVPFWWDRQQDSIRATIHQYRPDLIPDPGPGLPIPEHNPDKLTGFDPTEEIRFSFPPLWNTENDPTGWWVSEEYDCVRSIWTGKEFIVNHPALTIHVPKELSNSMPRGVRIDGGFWCGMGKRSQCIDVLQNADQSTVSRWQEMSLKLVIFDVKKTEKYEQRLEYLKSLRLPADLVSVVDPIKCTGRTHLQSIIRHNMMLGGTGLMLRQPESYFHYERHPSLFKYKFRRDFKARITALAPTYLLCQTKDAQIKLLRSSSSGNDIQLDDVVTLRPASKLCIHQVRKDVCWNRVMEEEYPYFIAVGRLGGTPHCYGCRAPLKDKKKLRVLVKSSYTPPNRIQNLPSLKESWIRYSCLLLTDLQVSVANRSTFASNIRDKFFNVLSRQIEKLVGGQPLEELSSLLTDTSDGHNSKRLQAANYLSIALHYAGSDKDFQLEVLKLTQTLYLDPSLTFTVDIPFGTLKTSDLRTLVAQYPDPFIRALCYRKSAQLGNEYAMCGLGTFYEKGEGVEMDLKKAVQCYTVAAELGDRFAQLHLARCYEEGIGVEPDMQEAFRWYTAAAKYGHAEAVYKMAMCYEDGRGVERDVNEAIKLCIYRFHRVRGISCSVYQTIREFLCARLYSQPTG